MTHLRNLKIFCDVVRHRSFSRAAEDNDLSQSGASQVVQQLEEGLGVRLIDRSKRPLVLTPEGEVYYEGARSVLQRYLALEDKVRTLHHEVLGRVRVASIYSVGLHLMSRHLQDFLTQYPRANVRLEYLHPSRVYQSVEDDLADIGLVSYPKSSRTLKAIAWREEPMVMVCAPGHPLANHEDVAIADLAGQRMVGFDPELSIRSVIDDTLARHRVSVQTIMEFDNIETIKRAIEIDAGIGLLPAPTVVQEVRLGTLKAIPLRNGELTRPLGIIYRRGKMLGSATQRFIELLKQEGDFNALTDFPVTSPTSDTSTSEADAFSAERDVEASDEAISPDETTKSQTEPANPAKSSGTTKATASAPRAASARSGKG